MWSSIMTLGPLAALGFLAFRSLTGSRVLALLIALRGTRPEERPEIIHALNAGTTPPEPTRERPASRL
ncbi:hypothetical protein [Lentzea flaviverrucosa]|uniref:Uncharacterized protein n=1 Tax=Lentzea flaviverrucosa TaxID=200379 RepID=A0A1H9UTP3_9PSEU|nr:hypothetical protein [Lentzea flaviverrucosa]RDI27748.1 hypothetical protein DFR72_106235 [Lentzea flaviverrucosa]SES12514.1 hypothetical protein SAMN05216195_109110 [Lentzea flaviverrucosa]